MNLSKKVALILGPSLAIVLLLAGYWIRTHSLDQDTPLELHAGLRQTDGVASPPSSPAETSPPPIEAPKPLAAQTPPVAAPESKAPDAEPAAQTPPVPAQPAAAPPKFDIVRVEPTGDAVIAGHTQPDSQVAVVANGTVIAEGKSDEAGQFVLLPPPLKPGDHALALQVTPPAGPTVTSDQNVAVSVPVKGKGDVMVALAEPGKATVLLADPTAEKAPPRAGAEAPAPPKEDKQPIVSPAKPEVSIKTVEIIEHGGFFATGLAALNAHLRLYLNGSVLVDVTAGTDGKWAVKIMKGLVPGHYAVRVDQIDPAGTVLARAEVPFDYMAPKPAEVAVAAPPSVTAPSSPVPPLPSPVTAPEQQASDPPPSIRGDAAAPSPPANTATVDAAPPAAAVSIAPDDPKPSNLAKAADSATAVVNEIQTTTVEKGSNLWRISRGTLGRGIRYTEIYAANASQIRDPKLIYPGQVFVIPGQVN